MKTITMRTLSRETARVLDELRDGHAGVVVSRDGEEVAVLTPMSPVERAMRARLREQGVDPDNPPPPDPDLTMLPPTPAGEKSAFDYLMEERDSYYREP
jgi:prevent-host-death family protein